MFGDSPQSARDRFFVVFCARVSAKRGREATLFSKRRFSPSPEAYFDCIILRVAASVAVSSL
jgi:hypothetical protein